MQNGNKVSFSSKNLKGGEYLVSLHKPDGKIDFLGIACKTNYGKWEMGKYSFSSFAKLKLAIRHNYTGSPFPDSN